MNESSSFRAWLSRNRSLGLSRAPLLLITALLLFVLPASVARGAPRGQNRLSLGSVVGISGATVAVPLELTSEDAVSGVQLEVQFDSTVVRFDGAAIAPRATGMTLTPSSPSAGRLRLVMFYVGGGEVQAGAGALANLDFRLVGAAGTATNLTLLPSPESELSDPAGAALSLTVDSGYVTVTGGADPTGACCATDGSCSLSMQTGCIGGTWLGANSVCTPNPCPPPPAADTLAIGTGSGASGTEVTVPLSLTNTQSVKALQLDVCFTATVVSWVSATAAARVAGMTFQAEPLAADTVRIVMYYGDASTMPPGSGAIANLVFRLGGSIGASSPLALSGVVVSDPAGQPIIVTNRNGGLEVTSGEGDPTGACCAASGACALTTQVACTAGIWRGANTSCTPNPCPTPAPVDTLAIGSASGPAGGQVTIPLNLANHVAVRGIQADIHIDPAVLRFESGEATARVGSMILGASSPTPDTVRMLLYYQTGSTLAPGRGAVANLVFRLTGSAGSQSSLTPTDIVVVDVDNQPIPTVGSTGQASVIAGGAPPDLRLAVLKNPGRVRTVQVFLSSDVRLDVPPTLTLAGGVAVPLTQLPGVDLYRGDLSVNDGTASVTLQATGIHDGATGTAQTTVTF